MKHDSNAMLISSISIANALLELSKKSKLIIVNFSKYMIDRSNHSSFLHTNHLFVERAESFDKRLREYCESVLSRDLNVVINVFKFLLDSNQCRAVH
jgi:uncharacterized protein YfeS